MTERLREEAKEVAAEKHGLARDDRDVRQDGLAVELLSMVRESQNMVRGLQEQVINHMNAENNTIKELKENGIRSEKKLDRILSGFANDDPESHREYHELLIATAKDRAAFWKRMSYHLIEVGFFGFLGWALYALWRAFLMGPK